MSSEDLEYERLIEALTITPSMEIAESPPFGGWIGNLRWRWHGYSRRVDGYDTVYRDSNTRYHRTFGPAYVSSKYNVEIWYKHGKFHRSGGPAITHNGNYIWYFDGKLHRIGGPAVTDGAGPKQYWIHGSRIPPKEYEREMARRKRKGIYDEN